MTFDEAIATQAPWIRIWITWMGIAIAGTFVVLLFSRKTWRDAAILLAVNVAMFFVMQWLYGQVGYVRLLGLPHVIFWTPLVIYFIWRLRRGEIGQPFRAVIWVFVATLATSLAIDYVDVARYLLGERGSLVPG